MSSEPQLINVSELLSQANALFRKGMLADAVTLYRQIVNAEPTHSVALNNCGVALEQMNLFDAALTNFDQALSVNSNYADAHYNRGNTLLKLKRFDEALTSYDKAIAIAPEYASAFSNRGIALMELSRFDDAVISLNKALEIKPDYAEAHHNLGIALARLERLNEALSACETALKIRPDYTEAFLNRGVVLQGLKRHEEALAIFERLLELKPDHPVALPGLAASALDSCDWCRTDRIARALKVLLEQPSFAIPPFLFLFYSDNPSLQLTCAKNFVSNLQFSQPQAALSKSSHKKIRIAYLSADFRSHPMSYLTVELFERHDRSRFEVVGISFGPDDRSKIRDRIAKAFDQFYDVRARSDNEVADLIRELEIDIAIDLMGHTRNARTGILALRPAPIQVSYLGFPGAMGADFIDYMIADEIVAPSDQHAFYTEKIVHLPDTYWVNSSNSMVIAKVPERTEAGLPEKGFVFCCFNKNAKVTATIFDVWMRLLQAVEGSVIWLLGDNPLAEKNLRKEATARGIDPNRLVFAGKLERDQHLVRYRLADLFLDTLPYNAHTTASEALQAGLPVVTCLGQAFAGRVAGSLLNALGLPELIAGSLEEYEALALKLARDDEYRANIFGKLERHLALFPLFDVDRFRGHIEAAYRKMWVICQRGGAPRHLTIPPLAKKKSAC